MAFKSIGQKYGFVSAGDVYRQRIADAEAKAQKLIDEERQKVEAERSKAEAERQKAANEHIKAEAERKKAENAEAELAQSRDDTAAVLREMGMSDELITKMQAKLDALRQSRLSKTEP